VLSVGAHASIRKAASIVGIGRGNVREIGDMNEEDRMMSFDLEALERTLKEAQENKRGVIVCPSYGEVNTVSSHLGARGYKWLDYLYLALIGRLHARHA